MLRRGPRPTGGGGAGPQDAWPVGNLPIDAGHSGTARAVTKNFRKGR